MGFEFLRRFSEPRAAREARARAEARAVEPRSRAPRSGRDYSGLRTPLRPQDLRLSALAHEWIDAMPPEQRPAALAAQFPRLANRLALCWGDPGLVQRVIDELLVDRRGGRLGFPNAVRRELLALRTAGQQQGVVAIDGLEVSEVDDVPWSRRTLGIGERMRDTQPGPLSDA